MHIALTAFGSRGDIQPVLALALGLQQAGHQAVLCAPPNFGAWVGESGVPFEPVGSDMQAWMDENAKLVAHRPIQGLKAMMNGLQQELESQFDHLADALQALASGAFLAPAQQMGERLQSKDGVARLIEKLEGMP